MSNVELVRGLYEAFGRGDLPTVLEGFDQQIQWRNAEGSPYDPEGKGWVGPDAVTNELFVRLANEWDGFTVTPAEFHETPDGAVVEGRYTGTYKATGRSVDAQFCHVWTAANGKLTGFQQYVDTAQMRGAMLDG